jgi:RimJ/RimL family protein N-acetyltransferase
MEEAEINTGNLHLRPWRPEDTQSVYEACQDPEIPRWTRVPSPYSLQDAQEWTGRIAPGLWASGQGAPFGIFDQATEDLLGSVGIHHVDRVDATASIGYWVAADARGRGIATQATLAVARWAFDHLAIARLDWIAAVGNDASRRVAERAGFTFEGVLRSRHPNSDGTRSDAWLGSLLPGDLRVEIEADAVITPS